jgi:hypothetical protein
MKLRILPIELGVALVLAGLLCVPAVGQQASPATPSVADAARAAQAQKQNSGNAGKVITNDDLVPPAPAPATPVATPEVTPTKASEAPQPQSGEASKVAAQAVPQQPPATGGQSGDCDNPERNDALQAELQAAQDELDQLRRDIANNSPDVSNTNVDMSNFKPGGSGVDFGSPPLFQTQPQSPDRVKEVMLEQRIASLKKRAVIACDSQENGEIQSRIDEAQKQLTLAQRELDLDSSTYYSNPNYSQDTAGKAKIDGEQEQVQSLQSEIDSLKQELAASKSN